MESNESIVLRIKDLISFYGLSNGGFADKIGVHRGDMSKYLSGKQRVGEKLKMQILFAYPNINKQWLLTGMGDMFNAHTTPDALLVDCTTTSQSAGIPFFDIEPASCGEFSGFGEAFTSNNIASRIVLPDIKAKQGDIFIKTKGRSMVDYEHPELSIPEGSIVLIREWKENYIAWGELYCVMTRSGYAVKRLMPAADDAHVSCVSADSQHYPPYTIALSDIVGIARVIGILTYKTV